MLLTFDKSNIPIGQDGRGSIQVEVPEPNQPIDTNDPTKVVLLDGQANVAHNEKWSWGTGDSARLGLEAETCVGLYVVTPETADGLKAQVKKYGLADALAVRGPLLLLEIGAKAGVSGSGSFIYGPLKAGLSLKAGAAGSAAWARPFDPRAGAKDVLEYFFAGLRFPAGLDKAPGSGEVTVFEYSGDLALGATVSAGFEAYRASAAEIGTLKLLESFNGGAVGKLSLGATVSGSFAVTVREAQDKSGKALLGWTRVVVTRTRTNTLTAAAGLTVTAELTSDGLPSDPKAFFGALLGVEAGNWVNWANELSQTAAGVTDVASLEAKLDALGRDFLKAWLGPRLAGLLGTEEQALLSDIGAFAKKYNEAEADVLALLDGYVDQGEQAVDGLLGQIQAATSWDAFKGEVNPGLWDLVNRVTGGDLLGWMLAKIPDGDGGHLPTVDDLKSRASQAAAEAKTLLHSELGGLLTTAREKFGFLRLMEEAMAELKDVGSPDALAVLASKEAGHFLARIVGEELDKIPASKQQAIFEALKRITGTWQEAGDQIRDFLVKAAKVDVEADLSAAYSRSEEKDALVDVAINLGKPAGLALYRAAVSGDFSKVFDAFPRRADLCLLNGGTFAHKLVRKRTLRAAICGWRDGFHYQDVSQVLMDCTQNVLPAGDGTLIVNSAFTGGTQEDLEEQDRERHTKFILALAAVSRPGVDGTAFVGKTRSFLVGAVQAKSAAYTLRMQDQDTTPDELRQYLAFAETAGLGTVDSLYGTLSHVIPNKNGHFRGVGLSYSVKFTKEALAGIFASLPDERDFHDILGHLVLGQYAGDGYLWPVGWAYHLLGPAFVDYERDNLTEAEASGLRLSGPKPVMPPLAPPSMPFTVDKVLVQDLRVLILMEKGLRPAWQELYGVLRCAAPEPPRAIEVALDGFLRASKKMEWFSREPNFLFLFFDGLARKLAPHVPAVASSLVVTFKDEDGTDRRVVFIAPQGAADTGV